MVNSTEVRYNDCWGTVQNGKEYAIAGSTEGIHFFSISNAGKLLHVDSITGRYTATTVIHRDVKTYQNYAYAVCDEGNSSLQIIDMSYLPDSVSLVGEIIDEFTICHNLFIDTVNSLLYACGPMHDNGVSNIQYKLDVYSVADPQNPVLVWSGDPISFPYVHDCYVRDNIAYLNCGDNGLRVYDFTNPASPSWLQNLDIYQDQGYNHQGWLSPDGQTYIFADETNGKRIKNCSVENNQVTIENYFGTNYLEGSIPHNMICSDTFAYVAYYNEGLRIYDLREAPPAEVAHFDTYPDDSPFKMNGAWGIYSELPSGRLLVSDRKYGLFLLDFREAIFGINSNNEVDLYPNPVEQDGKLIINLNVDEFSNLSVDTYSMKGQLIQLDAINLFSYIEIDLPHSAGVYHLRIRYDDYLGDEQVIYRKILVK